MLTITLTPGTTFPDAELVDRTKLRLGANPSVELSGTVEADDIGDAAVQVQHVAIGAFLVATTSGSGAAYVATSNNTAATAFTSGMWCWVIPHTDNTGACTLNLDGLGSKSVMMPNGSELYAHAMRTDTPALISYDTTLDVWVLGSTPANGLPIPVKGELTIPELTVPTVATVNVVADSAILTDPSTGAYTLWSDVNETANIALTGAGGLDVGSEAGTTKYYVYLVSDGTTLHAILSTSGTAPDKTNFVWTSKLLVGAVYNDSGSDFGALWCDWPTPRYVGDWTDPAAGYSAVTVTHSLGRRPKHIAVELKCVDAGASGGTHGFSVGDVLNAADTRQYSKNGESCAQPYVPVGSETTAIKVLLAAGLTVAVNNATPSASSGTVQLESGGTVYWQYRVIIET